VTSQGLTDGEDRQLSTARNEVHEMGDPNPTPAELDVVRAIARHGTVRGAAKELFLSPHTVDRHLDNLRTKTGLHHTPQLVAWAAANGWLDDRVHGEEGGGGDEGLSGLTGSPRMAESGHITGSPLVLSWGSAARGASWLPAIAKRSSSGLSFRHDQRSTGAMRSMLTTAFAVFAAVLLAAPPAHAENLTMTNPNQEGNYTIGTVIHATGAWTNGALNQYYQVELLWRFDGGGGGFTSIDAQNNWPQVTGPGTNHGDWAIDWNTTGRSATNYLLQAELRRSSDNSSWGAIITSVGQGGLTLQ
jgi:DNA-binding CsgD family transcriptional regulator